MPNREQPLDIRTAVIFFKKIIGEQRQYKENMRAIIRYRPDYDHASLMDCIGEHAYSRPKSAIQVSIDAKVLAASGKPLPWE